MDNRPIGVFDSGLGGLTVLKEIKKKLPGESLIYFGDSGRTPYGTKSKETVIKYSKQDIAFLLSMDVKLIVVACNTVSSVALPEIKDYIQVPVLEVIGPGAEAAINKSKTGRIGIIGTPNTIASSVYSKAIRQISPEAKICAKPCPLFVPLVEEGWWDNDIARMIAFEYLKDLLKENIDTLVLGCTHYPLLSNTIRKVVGKEIALVNSAEEVAAVLEQVLLNEDLLTDSSSVQYRYYTSDSVDKFKELGSLILGEEICNVERIDIDKYEFTFYHA
ncbi:MAG TPA: glutamate racemase [Ruminiclostridium sp.]|jgi:glutamate racemase|nr:glutamate racemase [Clostridiaceae bacterium]HAA25787.1 glutamate racemase [Ruminiclostridium sp.]